LFVERALGTSAPTNTVSGSIGFSGSSAQSYTPGQVIVSTGKIGTGYIRLNANPNDATTPYMDIVERTGSGVYDVDLKARLGDLSGITDTINGTAVSGFGLYTDNAFLKGGIVATYGSIGGLEIESNKIYFGNGTFGSSTFYVDNSGQFSLGNKLSWNGSTLSITGDITVSNPEDFIQPSETGSFTKNSATSSLENPTDYSFGGDATFPLNALPGTITTAGLYLGSNNLGYHDGSVYKTYMDSSGRFYLGGTSGALQWDGANLSVTGTITITNFDSTYGTLITGSFNDASSSFSTRTTNTEGTGSTLTTASSSMATQVQLTSAGMNLKNAAGTTTLASYGTTTTIGLTGNEHIEITSNSLKLKDNTTENITLSGTTITIGSDTDNRVTITPTSMQIGSVANGITMDTNGDATFNGDLNAVGGTFSGNLSAAGGTFSGTLSAVGGTFTGALSGGTISIGTAPNIFKADSNGIYLGNGTFASAPFRVAPNGALTAENITATGGTIAGWAIGSDTLQKLSGNAGVILDAGNSRISVSGSSSDTTGNSVVLDGGIGIIQVSQSGEGVFDTGRTRSFVTRHLIEPDIFKPGQPQAYVSESTTTTLPAPRFDNIDISSNLNVAGLARVEDSLFVDSTNADTAFSFVNQINRATAATNPDGATRPTASFAVNHTTNYSGNNQNSNCHPAFVFSANYFTELEADNNTIGWVQNSVPSGSNIFTIQARLDNHDNTDFEDAKFNVLGLETNTSGIAAARQNEYTFLQAKHSGSIRVQIQHDGDIVSKGNITGFASSFLTVSDKREKKDIYNISDSLDKILQLRPTHFTWIETDKPDVGFIAQEVEEVIPEVVETTRGFINTDDDKERKTISYPKLIPYLVDTIQTLTKRIEELEKQNTKIEVD